MTALFALGAIVCVIGMGYMVVVLLRPEKF
ncbi:MAG: potassium-transporting ATPase subunit F [Desulfobulbus sp.]|nr:potassium-transporting ATPase subunit F [Desulfobulbus sp.]